MRHVCPAIRLALAFVAPIVLSAQGLSITNYQLISQQPVGTNQWDLTYSATLVNTGAALGSVSATLSSGNPFSFRVLGQANTLSFSPVPANSQVPSANTFIVLSSSTSLDLTQVEWTFQSTPAGPTANAGSNQTAAVGSTVTLNGSASTTPSGVLTYSWKFSSRPAGSSTLLISATSIMPSFVVDVAGTYVVNLTISNGSQMGTANVTISTTSTAPVANAGPNQTVAVGATALLNGSASSDVDDNPLTFSWTMTNRPTGSAAALVGATTVTPSFVLDKAGSYAVQLIVKDGSISSAPSSVTITSENSPPVANAGAGQVVTVGSTVHLNGSGSTDADGNALTYLWSLITVPAGSAAKLSSTTAVNPTFTADLAGTYVAQLIANDGIANSTPATATITTIAILPPVANAGSNQTVSAGTVISLNGSGTDPQNLQLTFHWSLTTLPANSKAVLSSATVANPSFSADLPGTYIAQLQVSNGTMNSNPATVTITATAPSGLQVPANTVIVPGQTLPLNVTLGSPAPSGGLFVSLASSNPSAATVAAAFIIPGGAMAPATTPKVNGVALGSSTITATAVGFPPVTGTVQVTETLSFSPATLAVSGLTKGQLFLFLPNAAPSSGLTVNVSSSNPGVATVPATVFIGPGSTNINVPVTGVSYGSSVITASGANIAATTASVTVSAPVASGPPTIAGVSGTNQSAQVSTAFAAPFVVIVKDSNSTPISGATVSFSAPGSGASGTFGGGIATASTNTAGVATSAVFSANGTTGIYYVAASVSGAVTPASFFLTNLVGVAGSTNTAPAGGTHPALIAHTAVTSSNAGTVSTSAINTSGANTLLVCYGASTSGNVTNPISDTIGGNPSGNTWTLIKNLPYQSDTQASIWAAFGANVGANHVFSAQGYAPALAVGAFSGVSSGPDGAGASADGGTTPLTVGSLIPTSSDELIWNCLTGHFGNGGALGAVSPLTTLDQVASTGESVYGIMSAYEIQGTATATTIIDNWSGSLSYDVALAAPFFSVAYPAPLRLNTTSVAEGFKGTSYNLSLSISGGVQPYTCTITSGTLPAGLSLSGCTIAGTPTATASATPLIFRVTDTSPTPQTVNSSALALTIAASGLQISTTTCPSGTQYASYAGCVIAATGGTGPYTFSYSTSSNYAGLPEGLSLNSSTGAITSSQIGGQGTYGVDFIVTDSAGATTNKVINIALGGSNAFLTSIFPSNSIFHHRVDAASTGLPVDTSAAAPIAASYQTSTLKPFFGNAPISNIPNGIPALQVPYSQPSVPVTTTLYQSYFTSGPFPANAPVEATANCPSCDRHVLIYQEAGGGNPASLWEMWQGVSSGTGPWSDSSNALWSNVATNALTPQGTGTSDAAGLPVAPLLLNADEVIGTGTSTSPNGTVQHPTRFTLNHILNDWVWPATQTAGIGGCTGTLTETQISQSSPPSSCSWSGPAGEIYRLKASVSAPACASTSPQANIIITGMRNYGIILADNGISGGLIGTPDTRWNDSDLACLSQLTLADFEPVNVSSLMVSNNSGQTAK